MQKLIAVLILLSIMIPLPVRADQGSPDLKYAAPEPAVDLDRVKFAALDSADFIPVEKKLIDEQTGTPARSNWWKWALGILAVGAIAAAAGGGGGGGGSQTPATGSTTVAW